MCACHDVRRVDVPIKQTHCVHVCVCVFVRHCASLSKSIIRGGSRGRREMRVCIDGTCIIILKVGWGGGGAL